MSSHDPFGHLQHKLWQKKRLGIKLPVWLPTTKSREIDLTSVRADGVWYTVGKVLMRATTLLQTSSRLEVWTRNYGPAKLRESNLSSFGTPLWESRDKKAIWMWALWRGTENTIWGKVVASPESRLWWVLWVQSRPWLVLAPKVLQHNTNQLVIGWMQIRVNE
jgi:hypothetical protein